MDKILIMVGNGWFSNRARQALYELGEVWCENERSSNNCKWFTIYASTSTCPFDAAAAQAFRDRVVAQIKKKGNVHDRIVLSRHLQYCRWAASKWWEVQEQGCGAGRDRRGDET